MKVALRDDDTSYFTEPGRLESVYHDVWDRIPVGLAVIPHAAGFADKAIPEKYWDAGRAFPLDDNAPLVASLRKLIKDGRVSISQHGFTHEDYPDGHEFQAAPDIETRLARGQAFLERTLDTRIRVFVPPHNALSKRGLEAVDAAGLNLLGSFLSFRPSLRPWDLHTAGNWWRIKQYRDKTGRSKADRLVYPHVLRYRNHGEFGCYGLIPNTSFEDLKRGFDEARAAGGDFCLATHYWEIDDALKAVLQRFLDYAASCNEVRFVPVEQLFQKNQ
jgi:predicted deacetylase